MLNTVQIRAMTFLVVALFSIGCRTLTRDTSSPKIINGIPFSQAPDEWQDTLSAVRKIDIATLGSCTGTFIADEWMQTAAHCVVPSTGFGPLSVSVEGIAVSYISVVPPEYAPGNSRKYDLALVRFAPGTSARLGVRRFPPIAPCDVEVDQTVYVAGFGKTRADDRGGVGHFGWNAVFFLGDGTVELSGGMPRETPGDNAVSFQGDSGGPLFDANQNLIATTSNGYFGEDSRFEQYACVGTEVFRRLLSQAGAGSAL